jgi:phenylacetate-CoA ligase
MRRFTRRENATLAWRFAISHRNVENFNFLRQDQITAWQLDRIRELVDVAYNHTDLYRHKYDAAGIHPRDIQNWQDFTHLPVLTKQELIEFGLRAVDNRRDPEGLFVSKSSGSSGEVVSVYMDVQAMIKQAIQAIRMIKEMCPGYGPLDRELLIYTSEYPYTSIGGFYRAAYAHTLLPTRRLVDRITSIRPAVIAVYPSILKDIVRLRDSGEPMRHLKAVITNSEQSLQEERDLFASQLDCTVYDEFSSEELSSIAYQCRHRRYHVTQDSTYIEVLSPTADPNLPAGQVGEIVGTCLINTAMPIIRYRQGDLASLRAHRCQCGRTGPVLEALVGRKNDSFRRIDGTEIPSGQILDWTYELILNHKLGVREFQIIQETKQHVNVNLVVEPTYNEFAANRIIEWNFRRTFGEEFEVAVSIVPNIPRTKVGKYNPIRSMVQPLPPR